MAYTYRAFGLTIDSCLALPGLTSAHGKADIFIRKGSVPVSLQDPIKQTKRFQAKPGSLLMTDEEIARILVSNGNQIIVDMMPGVEEDRITSFVLGSGMGAILHQRGLLPIHASAIQTGNACIMFCGKQRAGKSTIAAMFVKRGYPLHADDLCVITINPQGKPIVYPAYPQLKLWSDALTKTGHDSTTCHPLHSITHKFAVPASGFNSEPLPIQKIFVLTPHDHDHIEVTPIHGIDKYKTLTFQTFRRRFPEGLGTQQSHFNIAAHVAKHIPIFRVHRPKYRYLLNELADTLESYFL